MRHWTILLCTALCLATLALLASPPVQAAQSTQPAPAGEPIRIGALLPMTGSMATFGESTNKGIQLAVEEKNQAGGLLGRPVAIQIGDSASSAADAERAVRQLIDEKQVVAVLGDVASGLTIAAAPACQKAKIPLLTPLSTNPAVTKQGDFIFRACMADDFQGMLIARFAADVLKAKKAATLTEAGSGYSAGIADSINAEFTKRGGTVAAKETFKSGDKDFAAQLTAIKNAKVDVVFLPAYYTDAPHIVKQARELGLTCPFIGGDGWESDDLVADDGTALDGCFFITHYAPTDTDAAVAQFVKKFKERFKGEPPDSMEAAGYDAANLLFKAIEDVKSTDGTAIRDALARIKTFAAVTGPITIGPDRNPIKPAVVMEIKGGKVVFKQRIAP